MVASTPDQPCKSAVDAGRVSTVRSEISVSRVDAQAMDMKVIRVLQRGLDVLDALDYSAVTEIRHIHHHTRLPKPTIVRLLETLCVLGYVARREGGGYELTSKILALSRGYQAVDSHRLLKAARPIMGWLREQTSGWPSDLVTCDTEAMTVIDPGHSTRILPITRDRGYRLPIIGTAVGHAHLAFCPEAERDELLGRMIEYPGPYSGRRNSSSLRAMLDTVRAKGYATRDCDVGKPIRVVAAPVLAGNKVVACLSIIVEAKAMSLRQMERSFTSALAQAASGIGRAYHGQQ